MHNVPRNLPKLTEAENAVLVAKIGKYQAAVSMFLDHRSQYNLTSKITDEQAKIDLELTSKLIALNPDFYSLWNYRRELQERNISLDASAAERICKTEMALSIVGLQKNPKCYHAWHHRVWVLGHNVSDLNEELSLCNKYLLLDSRNFHCWNYRSRVAKLAEIEAKDELEFTSTQINNNFSNFSAWHYRTNVLLMLHDGLIPLERVKLELLYVHNCFIDPRDQSGWIYHRWICSQVLKWTTPISNVHIITAFGQRLFNDQQRETRHLDGLNEAEIRQIQFEIFVSELAQCRSILERDPREKYVILCTVLMLGACHHFTKSYTCTVTPDHLNILNGDICKQIRDLYEKLVELDSPRVNYYKQLCTNLTA